MTDPTTPQDAPKPPKGASPSPTPTSPSKGVVGAAPDPHGRSAGELTKGYARPLRDAVVHKTCGQIVVLGKDVAEVFARTPGVLGTISCPHGCGRRPVGEYSWHGAASKGAAVGS